MFRFSTVVASLIVLPLSLATLPAKAASFNPAAVLPDGFLLEKLIRADVDGDGRADYVAIGTDGPVPIPDELSEGDGEGNRLLMITSATGKVYGTGKGAIICRRCGGAFWGVLVPTIDVKVLKGLVTVHQYGGANEVTDWSHHYRVEKGRVRLTGFDRSTVNRATGANDATSTNLLTGVSTQTHSEIDKGVTWKKLKGKPRVVWLEDVTID